MWRYIAPAPGSPKQRKQRSELKRKTPLRSKRRHLKLVDDPAREAWKAHVAGICNCGCGTWVPRLERHHVLLEQIVRREHGEVWSLANSMLLAPDCHERHHNASRKIRLDAVPDEAVEFAVELLGAAAAMIHFDRRYDTSGTPETAA